MTGDKQTLARLHAALNSADPELIATTIDEVVAPGARIRTPLPGGVTGGEALKTVFAALYRAYPDLHVAVEDMIAEGDRIVCRNTVTGTHRGEYMGLAPTGRSVTYDEIFVFRFAGGRIVETWGVVDVLAQLRQLGAVPGPPGPDRGVARNTTEH
ncbi:ester cyclase [Pseudonocardia humida]|uniref:Ester cyclase n=1 Tax=Pseudonocardia humida TaxID=2800819 RepID=A0ABT1A919_9PSEU|nr:ester cyclase [Pseudonocardia humida]MCO1659324.1 ester cyclase [Pseudonocardia humida]